MSVVNTREICDRRPYHSETKICTAQREENSILCLHHNTTPKHKTRRNNEPPTHEEKQTNKRRRERKRNQTHEKANSESTKANIPTTPPRRRKPSFKKTLQEEIIFNGIKAISVSRTSRVTNLVRRSLVFFLPSTLPKCNLLSRNKSRMK